MQTDFIMVSGAVNHMGPVPDKGGTDLMLRPGTKPKTQKPSLYQVVMLNDDFTSMAFVVDVLQRHFNKAGEQAQALMMEVHKKGAAVAGIYPYDVAETKQTLVMDEAKRREYPFMLKLDKV